MGRKSLSAKEKKPVHRVCWQITEEVYQRLKKMVKEGDCNSINEAARRVLSGDEINIFYIDDSFNLSMERLCEIRSELKNIEMHISQITGYFNSAINFDDKVLHSLNILELYHQVGTRVDMLLLIVGEIAKKWLHV